MPPACCAPVQEALPLLRRDRRWQMYDREPIPSWVDGCLALLSDAAHPTRQYLAQGACQSMQDGVALPNALTGAADVPTGLAGYADARRDRAARVQATAQVWGRAGMSTGRPAASQRAAALAPSRSRALRRLAVRTTAGLSAKLFCRRSVLLRNRPIYSVESVDHALHLALVLQEGPLQVADAAERLEWRAPQGAPAAAVSIAMPTTRYRRERLPEWSSRLATTAERMGRELNVSAGSGT